MAASKKTYSFHARNLLKSFIFVHLLLLEDYEQGALQKELIIAPLMNRF